MSVNSMTTLEKLHAIESVKTIYAVHWCRAGVGFQFYEGPAELHGAWRNDLRLEAYYGTFEEAVDAEYERIAPSTACRTCGQVSWGMELCLPCAHLTDGQSSQASKESK